MKPDVPLPVRLNRAQLGRLALDPKIIAYTKQSSRPASRGPKIRVHLKDLAIG
jgi:hypothetical protein